LETGISISNLLFKFSPVYFGAAWWLIYPPLAFQSRRTKVNGFFIAQILTIMSVIKIQRRENPFVQIDKSVFEDDQISWKAKGVLGYLLSKPHGWKVHVSDIVNHAPKDEAGQSKKGNGEDAVYQALSELRIAGYASLSVRRENGVIVGKEWLISELKCANPYRDNPDMANPEIDNPDVDNPAISNNDLRDNESSNNDLEKISAKADLPTPLKEDERSTQKQSVPRRRAEKKEPHTPKDVFELLNKDPKHGDFFRDVWKIWEDYLEHRKEMKVKAYASAKSESLAVIRFYEMAGGSKDTAQKIVNQSRANQWAGLFGLKDQPKANTSQPQPTITNPKIPIYR